jgi:HSP20 family protein
MALFALPAFRRCRVWVNINHRHLTPIIDMNSLTRWNPIRELEEFQNRILSAFRPDSGRSTNGNEELTAAAWAPGVNIWEDDKGYYLEADLPGLEKKNVKVTLENRVLTLSGERAFDAIGEKYRHHVAERSFGRFMRSFTLPSDVDPGSVEARFKNGVLFVHLAKSETARPREIAIKVNE